MNLLVHAAFGAAAVDSADGGAALLALRGAAGFLFAVAAGAGRFADRRALPDYQVARFVIEIRVARVHRDTLP